MLLTRFKSYDDILDTLSEAHLWKKDDKKYSNGWIKITPETVAAFPNISAKKYDGYEFDTWYKLTKTQPGESKPITINILANPKEELESVFLTSTKTGKVLELISSRSHDAKKVTFSQVEPSTNESDDTENSKTIFTSKLTYNIETAQALGLFVNFDELKNRIVKDQAGKDEIIDILNRRLKSLSSILKDQDFDPRRTFFKHGEIDKNISDESLSDLLTLMEGSWNFSRDIVHSKFGNNFHIVHGKINDYYEAEKKNPNIDIKSNSKKNTSDLIVVSIKVDDFLTRLGKDTPVKYNNDGVIYFETDPQVQWLQVSLKKSKEGAQLGKYTSWIKKYLNIDDNENLIQATNESTIISEALSMKNFVDVVKKIGKDVWNKIKDLYKNVSGWTRTLVDRLNSSFKEQQKKDLVELSKLMGLNESELYECITEAAKIQKSTKLNPNKFLDSLTQSQKDILLDNVNKRAYQLENTFKAINGISPKFDVIYKFNKIDKLPVDISRDGIYKLFGNYTAYEVLRKIVGTELVTKEKVIDNLVQASIEINKEIYYGSTTLPVWKVYGVSSVKKNKTHMTYEYIGTAADYEKSIKEKNISGQKIIFGFKSTSQEGGYYNLAPYFLNEIDENGEFKYAATRAGSNRDGAYTFVMEGTKTVGEDQLKKIILK